MPTESASGSAQVLPVTAAGLSAESSEIYGIEKGKFIGGTATAAAVVAVGIAAALYYARRQRSRKLAARSELTSAVQSRFMGRGSKRRHAGVVPNPHSTLEILTPHQERASTKEDSFSSANPMHVAASVTVPVSPAIEVAWTAENPLRAATIAAPPAILAAPSPGMGSQQPASAAQVVEEVDDDRSHLEDMLRALWTANPLKPKFGRNL